MQDCACKVKCGDVPQEQDHPEAVCKMLPGLGNRILDAIIAADDDAAVR